MLSSTVIAEAVRRTHEAERTRTPVRALSFDQPDMTIEDAYTIQRLWTDLKIKEGRTVRGHKIGLTSRAMQAASQIDEPDYGTLLDDMFFADGADIPMARFIAPMLEVELAFVLERRLEGPNCTLLDVLEATQYVTPALELIDARTFRIDPETKRPRRVVDTIADNAADAGVILGGRPVKPNAVDLRWVAALFYRNGIIAWLANKLSPFGIGLEAGEVVLAGSFTRPVPCRAGDVFHADYGPLGAITCRFS